jgi:hypothetical protein
MYRGYFVPIALDPYGFFTDDVEAITKAIKSSVCQGLSGLGDDVHDGKDEIEYGWHWYEDEDEGVVAGSTIKGIKRQIPVDSFADSAPPENVEGEPVGTSHTHPSGASASLGDHNAWFNFRSERKGRWIDTVLRMGEDCCDGDPDKYGVSVEVWIWSSSRKRPNSSIADRHFTPYGKTYAACADAGGTHRDCSRQAMAAAAKDLIKKKILESYFTVDVCCDRDQKSDSD